MMDTPNGTDRVVRAPAGEMPKGIPLWAIRAARRLMQLNDERKIVEVHLIEVDGVRYLAADRKELERLG